MLVTLYCDASFDPKTYAGGWAVWVRSDVGRIVRGGICPPYFKDSTEAELGAAFAGLWLALRDWPQSEKVLVRSDCQTVTYAIKNRMLRKPSHQRLQTKILDLAQEKNVKLIPRWVKGHQKTGARDAWLNRQVDQLARKNMERARAALTVSG